MAPLARAAPFTTILEAAHYYARHGWFIMPLWWLVGNECACGKPKCGSEGKHPLTQNGVYDATKAARTIDEWWGEWPDANLGIATGQSGLAVVDVDPGKGGLLTWKAIENKQPEKTIDTLRVRTGGGGLHFFFRDDPGDPIRNTQGGPTSGFGPGVDTRGHAGHVVAPVSRHRLGTRYEWVHGRAPWEHRLAPFPPALRALLESRVRTPEGLAPPVADRIPMGERHNSLFSLGASMRARNFVPRAIDAALRAQNEEGTVEPVPEHELAAIIRDVLRLEPAPTRTPPPWDRKRGSQGDKPKVLDGGGVHAAR